MKRLHAIWKKRKLLIIDSFLVILGFSYYLFFVNKGLVLSDEGYYVHYAERIANGQVPYKDFILQYSPGYFYLLALFYKIFGTQILVGRFVSLITCVGILIATQVLLRFYKIKLLRFHILASLTIISLGYPLLHIPLVIWVCVLISLFLVMCFLKWRREENFLYVGLIGLLLSMAILTKQNVGIVFIVLLNCFILLSGWKRWGITIRALAILNAIWIGIVGLLVFAYFVYVGNITGILAMFALSKQFLDTYAFTYPSLTYLFQPTGIFKLLPYYFPIVCLFLVLFSLKKRSINLDKLFFITITLTGFFVTVYPASDLLHAYPFLGILIVSSLIYFYKKFSFYFLLPITLVFILLGFYITFFMQSYRYEGYFLKETAPLSLPKTTGITFDPEDNGIKNLIPLNNFFQKYTKKGDYIFVYPFSPMLYFVLDRQNPTGVVQFVLLEAPDSVYSGNRVIEELKQKRVRYIIGAGPYKSDQKISKFIQQQKKVYTVGPYDVYEIR